MSSEMNMAPDQSATPVARALDVETREIYWPAERPGWVSWVTVWPDEEGGLLLAFEELRRGKNPLWEPVPLDFWESMGLPVGYHETLCNGSPDLINEIVVLKSADAGQSWTELSRTPTNLSMSFAWASLPDGRLIRSNSNDYVAWHPGETQHIWSEVSADGGRTWTRQSEIAACHNGSGTAHRLRRLRDGTVVQLISAVAPFGPGRERANRHTVRAFAQQELSVFLFFSQDEGQTWTGPCAVLPGVMAWEPDFVELPSGEILVLNSSVQHGPQVRQYVRRGPWGWIPGPVFDVVSGRVPECLVYTQSGLILGAVRGGEYTVSNDEGATWHAIAGLPACGYQPFLRELPDGRLFCAWHGGGGDEAFGEVDLYIGAHVFRLEANLPQPTRLALERDLNEAGDHYLNRYTLTLTAGDALAPGQTIHYHVEPRAGRPQSPPAQEGTAVTDSAGQAVIDLTAMFAGVDDTHLGYTVKAWFEPPAGAGLSPARADSYYAYAVTATRTDLGW